MIESEDGTVTGSIDVNRLGEIDPRTDEAKAQIDALKAQAGQEQAAKDAEAKAEQEKAQSVEGQKESQKETTIQAGPPDDKASARKSSSSGKE